MKVIVCEQRSPEWFAARLGRLTGSRASDMLATTKKGVPSTSRQNLLMELVLERLTGKSQAREFQSRAMQDGAEREAAAANAYEAITGHVLKATGFIEHDELMAGCSLDGHYGNYEGIVEIKSPIPATHLEYLKTGKVPTDYYRQCLHNMWITGAQWCDWLSYQPDFPEHLQVRMIRIERNEADIDAYAEQAASFLEEVALEHSGLLGWSVLKEAV